MGYTDQQWEYASEHSGHPYSHEPDPLIMKTGNNRDLAKQRVKMWERINRQGRNRVIRRRVITTYGPWEADSPEQSD